MKGGTTVSRIAELITGIPLRICGRITERGTVSSYTTISDPHSIIIENGQWRNIDMNFAEEVKAMGSSDLIVISANAIDGEKRAAFMAGSLGGGNVGESVSRWLSEGVPVLIPAGIEKMIPGNLKEIIPKSGRKGKNLSWGMGVGLLPLYGEIITEIEAVKYLADVECYAIGAGGLGEAQGSVTLEVLGDQKEVDKIIEILQYVKNQKKSISGVPASLEECEAICENCGNHLACGYKKGILKENKKQLLGIITIGQSPRDDLVAEIKEVLKDRFRIIECGALDGYSHEEVVERFSPTIDDVVLVTRMKDGSQVKIGEKYVLPLLQKCIRYLEERKAAAILLLCTGKFPPFQHHSLLITPQELLHAIVEKISTGQRVGLILPDEDQAKQAKDWWMQSGVKVEVEIASPYKSMVGIEGAAHALKNKDISMIFMDCMGYSLRMKEKVQAITGKPVILPRTLIANVIRELF